jgi:hypothetical protein
LTSICDPYKGVLLQFNETAVLIHYAAAMPRAKADDSSVVTPPGQCERRCRMSASSRIGPRLPSRSGAPDRAVIIDGVDGNRVSRSCNLPDAPR